MQQRRLRSRRKLHRSRRFLLKCAEPSSLHPKGLRFPNPTRAFPTWSFLKLAPVGSVRRRDQPVRGSRRRSLSLEPGSKDRVSDVGKGSESVTIPMPGGRFHKNTQEQASGGGWRDARGGGGGEPGKAWVPGKVNERTNLERVTLGFHTRVKSQDDAARCSQSSLGLSP